MLFFATMCGLVSSCSCRHGELAQCDVIAADVQHRLSAAVLRLVLARAEAAHTLHCYALDQLCCGRPLIPGQASL
jgi:hypothetical protein